MFEPDPPRPGLRPRAHVLLARRAEDRAPGGTRLGRGRRGALFHAGRPGRLESGPGRRQGAEAGVVQAHDLSAAPDRRDALQLRLRPGDGRAGRRGLPVPFRGGQRFPCPEHRRSLDPLVCDPVLEPVVLQRHQRGLWRAHGSRAAQAGGAADGHPGDRRSVRRGAGRRVLQGPQQGKVDRSGLGEEFSHFLEDGIVPGAAARMKAYGEPLKAEVESIGERGGMEVSTTRLEFASGSLKVLMYRTPDGKIQQHLLPEGLIWPGPPARRPDDGRGARDLPGKSSIMMP
ncbi:MAG: hypothetical protein M0C28_07730 [Candidatus Moduliflexus flocculans]|nr:hypothetical protein [Candidatus Moduliflexus flocculans]